MAVKSNGSLPPSKKRKSNSGGALPTAKSVSELEKQVSEALQENASLNSLADLLHIATTIEDPEICLKAIFALYRSFVLIIQKGLLDSGGLGEDSERKVVRQWVLARLDTFTEFLFGLFKDEEKILRTSALKILFSILRQLSNRIGVSSDPSSSTSNNTSLKFDVPFFKKTVQAILDCRPSARHKKKKGETEDRLIDLDVRDQLLESWLNAYADVRWFFLRETSVLLGNTKLIESNNHIVVNALTILEKLTNFPTESNFSDQKFWVEDLGSKPLKKKKGKKSTTKETTQEDEEEDEKPELDPDDWRAFFDEPKQDNSKGRVSHQRIHTMSIHEQLHYIGAHRAVFTKCWLTLLPLLSSTSSPSSKSSSTEKRNEDTLVLITRALNILHISVLPHLTRAILTMDWVSACVDFGGNVGLLALNALFILMRDYNLDYPQFYTRLYAFLNRDVLHFKHRARFFRLTELFLSSTHLPATLLASFVKRLSRLSLNAPPAAIIMIIPFTYNVLKRHPALMGLIHRTSDSHDDPFDPNQIDPTLTKALDSSLWELYSQKRHYHSVVSTMTKVFEEAFTKPNYAMEDFLDHTYATLFDSEINRKIKKEPALLESVAASEVVDDILSIWQLA